MKYKKLEWGSDPISNHTKTKDVGQWLHDRIFREIMVMHRSPRHQHPVAFHKARLGRQNYTWISYGRKWVWEDPIGWRVYVSNDGIVFEVKSDLTTEELILAWDDYLGRMGIKEMCIVEEILES